MSTLRLNSIEIPGADAATEPRVGTARGATEPGEFADKLKDAIGKIDELQTQADEEARNLAAGHGNLHETMLALEKADVTMRVAMKVRTRILDAYNEVMRMPV